MRDNLMECKVLNDQFVQYHLKHDTRLTSSWLDYKTVSWVVKEKRYRWRTQRVTFRERTGNKLD